MARVESLRHICGEIAQLGNFEWVSFGNYYSPQSTVLQLWCAWKHSHTSVCSHPVKLTAVLLIFPDADNHRLAFQGFTSIIKQRRQPSTKQNTHAHCWWTAQVQLITTDLSSQQGSVKPIKSWRTWSRPPHHKQRKRHCLNTRSMKFGFTKLSALTTNPRSSSLEPEWTSCLSDEGTE